MEYVKKTLFLDICKQNYLALLKMVQQAIKLCPDDLWSRETNQPQFWQEVYHTLFYLDFYLSSKPKAHQSKFDFKENLAEKPSIILSKDDISTYLKDVETKTNEVFNSLTTSEIEGKNSFWWTGPTLGHRLIYNLRHSQHHMGKINEILKSNGIEASKWVINPEKA